MTAPWSPGSRFVAKPFDPFELLTIVESMVNRRNIGLKIEDRRERIERSNRWRDLLVLHLLSSILNQSRVSVDTDHPDEGRRDDGRHSQEFPILLTK